MQPTQSPTDTSAERPRRWRKRLRRVLTGMLTVLMGLLFAVWFFVLRIVEHDSWPPPADAITSAQAQTATEEFFSRDKITMADGAIPLAPSTVDSVTFYSDGTQ